MAIYRAIDFFLIAESGMNLLTPNALIYLNS